ncbi:MAG: hypothetical protein AAFN94_03290 [Pseudomonadota bacterium]
MTRFYARNVRFSTSMDRARMADLRADFIRSYSPTSLPGLIAGSVLSSMSALAGAQVGLGQG